jgi:hypothetical protein
MVHFKYHIEYSLSLLVKVPERRADKHLISGITHGSGRTSLEDAPSASHASVCAATVKRLVPFVVVWMRSGVIAFSRSGLFSVAECRHNVSSRNAKFRRTGYYVRGFSGIPVSLPRLTQTSDVQGFDRLSHGNREAAGIAG